MLTVNDNNPHFSKITLLENKESMCIKLSSDKLGKQSVIK